MVEIAVPGQRWKGNGSSDNVGIVEKVENGVVHTVEGNSGDACKQRSYILKNIKNRRNLL
jgi:hypothetical protein